MSLVPSAVMATTEGVVLIPSAFSMTLGADPSMMATQELVVPRSIPIMDSPDLKESEKTTTVFRKMCATAKKVCSNPHIGYENISLTRMIWQQFGRVTSWR